MKSRMIVSEKAPKPIGPYSQAIRTEKMVFTSGQIAINPANGLLAASDVQSQTKQVLENLSAVLQAAGASFETVVKTTIYLKNMDDFALVNEVYAGFFSQSLPARSTVEVARLPKDALIEIDCIALLL